MMDDATEQMKMKDMVSFICRWKWKMSAMGLFEIRRSLICSVSSIIKVQ
jgi:hypothetical protein